MTRGSGLMRTNSEMQFVSSKNPLIDLRLYIDVARRAAVPLQIKFQANQRRLPEKVDDILRLTRFTHQLFILLLGNHHHAFLALPRDALRSFGASLAEDLAEAGLRALDLPGLGGRLGNG